MRLTRKMLEAMQVSLSSALAGEGFDGGDFAGYDMVQFEKASKWISAELRRRDSLKKQMSFPFDN